MGRACGFGRKQSVNCVRVMPRITDLFDIRSTAIYLHALIEESRREDKGDFKWMVSMTSLFTQAAGICNIIMLNLILSKKFHHQMYYSLSIILLIVQER